MKLFTKILLSAFLVVCFFQSHGQGSTRLRAEPDTFTVLQASVDTFAVTAVDSIPAGDSVCISLIGSPPGFSILNCHSIIFRPDSTFTGRDTCRYALCDTAGICDSATVVVYVDTNAALLPVAGFVQDSIYTFNHASYIPLFTCGLARPPECLQYKLANISVKFDSVSWFLRDTCNYCFTSTPSQRFGNIDTLVFVPDQYYYTAGTIIYIYITAYNKYGSVTFGDTSCILQICEGISEIPLANIHIYPDPADNVLTIDMRQNADPISTDYAAINVYNNLGQKVRSILRHDSSKVVEIPVMSLPDGIYLSTIVDAGGTEMMLGRFTVMK